MKLYVDAIIPYGSCKRNLMSMSRILENVGVPIELHFRTEKWYVCLIAVTIDEMEVQYTLPRAEPCSCTSAFVHSLGGSVKSTFTLAAAARVLCAVQFCHHSHKERLRILKPTYICTQPWKKNIGHLVQQATYDEINCLKFRPSELTQRCMQLTWHLLKQVFISSTRFIPKVYATFNSTSVSATSPHHGNMKQCLWMCFVLRLIPRRRGIQSGGVVYTYLAGLVFAQTVLAAINYRLLI